MYFILVRAGILLLLDYGMMYDGLKLFSIGHRVYYEFR